MRDSVLARLLIAFVIAIMVTIASLLRLKHEFDEPKPGKGRSYSSFSYFCALPLYLALFVVIILIFRREEFGRSLLLGLFYSVFFSIMLYYLLLTPLMPWLRRHISAWACAALWLLPNILYLTSYTSIGPTIPLLILDSRGDLAITLFYVWLAGFCLIMLWKAAEHLSFRRRVLRDAVELSSGIWLEELAATNLGGRGKPRLMRSPAVTTPLTVGLSLETMVVLLPERSYSDEELRLVLRHELIHIARRDSASKLALVSIAALCWFYPLSWFAMRRSAEDIELCCDESLLYDASQDERRRYAELILSSAGDGRGFTTCLSARASSLRYRLKSIMQPAGKSPGALVLGLAAFLLIVSCGQVALAYGGGTGAELLFRSQDPALCVLDDTPCTDTEALNDYLASLDLRELAGDYDFSENRDGQYIGLMYDSPGGQFHLGLYDDVVEYLPFFGTRGGVITYYYLPAGMDWELLDALFPGQGLLEGGEL